MVVLVAAVLLLITEAVLVLPDRDLRVALVALVVLVVEQMHQVDRSTTLALASNHPSPALLSLMVLAVRPALRLPMVVQPILETVARAQVLDSMARAVVLGLLSFAIKALRSAQVARSQKSANGMSTRLRHLGVLLHRPVAAVALARRRRPYKSWSPVVVAEAAGRIEAAGRRTVAVVAEAAVSTAPSS
jgi:hypothetical protein